MKSVKLKDYQDGLTKSTTKEILLQIIDYSGTAGGGITTSEQRKRIKLLDLLESQFETGELNLEDADYNYIVQLIDGMKWAVSNKMTRDFIKDFS